MVRRLRKPSAAAGARERPRHHGRALPQRSYPPYYSPPCVVGGPPPGGPGRWAKAVQATAGGRIFSRSDRYRWTGRQNRSPP